jgi:diguanylate cyclase (GGDEF)-like protein
MEKALPILRFLNVLLIEDSQTDAILIEKALSGAAQNHYHVRRAETLEAALRILAEDTFDTVLLDLSLPDVAGFNGLFSVQHMAPKLPVVILTAHEDEEVALRAVEFGAQDYLFKNRINGPGIERAMHYAIQRKRFEDILITRANFDPLTDLANRLLFENRLDIALARKKRSKDGIGVFFLDLDHFKQVNDTMGHAAGDQLLQHVAKILKQSVRPYDTAARFGGDEFALIIEGIKEETHCAVIAQKIIRKIGEPCVIAGRCMDIGVSIGIVACLAEDHLAREACMDCADAAMYAAKRAPHSDYQFYHPSMNRLQAVV